MSCIANKYDFSLFFEAVNSNPNGDPDAGNMPRIDPEACFGIVTDVCLKSKIRNYVSLAKDGEPGYAIYVQNTRTLNQADLDAAAAKGIVGPDVTTKTFGDALKKALKEKADVQQLLKEAACAMYFDVRAFGAVMTSYSAAGAAQIRGPVQIGFARSVDAVAPQEFAISRQAVATEKEVESRNNAGAGTLGRKYVVPYGLYRADGSIDAAVAEKYSRLLGGGFSEADLALFWEAMENMFEHDRSACRSGMSVRKLVIFRHGSKMGNCQSHKLLDRVSVVRKPGVAVARSFSDYEFSVDTAGLPAGVTCEIRD